MDMLIGLAELALIVWAVAAWRRRSRARTPRPEPRSQTPLQVQPPGAVTLPPRPDGAGPVAGWLLGHQIAQHHTGLPGDPLPGGHLGSPTNLAFWGGVFADDEEDQSGDDLDA